MKNLYRSILCISILILAFPVFCNETIIDYLSIGNNINFDSETYHLKWSSHPSETYYKQEFLQKDDTLDKYQSMIIIEALKGDFTVDQIASFKVQELEKWKIKNPTINYQRFEEKETHETIIDFLISDGSSINEWNAYRYQLQQHGGNKYIVLYAYSYRNYTYNDKDLMTFYSFIKNNRLNIIEKIKRVEIPKIRTNN